MGGAGKGDSREQRRIVDADVSQNPADQKEMITDNDRSVERWTFVHFAEQNEAILETAEAVDVELMKTSRSATFSTHSR
jgi:hypothetical protein